MKQLVLIGGGHTHALVLRHWLDTGLPNAKVTLISPSAKATYSGMLPGFVSGHYQADDLEIDLCDLCARVGVSFICSPATALDQLRKAITTEDEQVHPYDIASFDIGITTQMPQLKGFFDNATPAKPLDIFAKRWSSFLGNMPKNPKVAVIGGGVAGVELSLAMSYALRQCNGMPRVTLLDRGVILKALRPQVRKHLKTVLHAAHVDVCENADIKSIEFDGIALGGHQYLPADFIVGAAGATAHRWLEDTKLELTNGFIAVTPHLKSRDPSVFAVGDCAHMSQSPRPKAGVYAVRQAPILAHNLQASLSQSDMPLRAYTPQSDYLKLISLGDKKAMGEKFGFVFSGRLVWSLKKRIDCQFMTQFRHSNPPI